MWEKVLASSSTLPSLGYCWYSLAPFPLNPSTSVKIEYKSSLKISSILINLRIDSGVNRSAR